MKRLPVYFLLMTIAACTVKPEPIDYGHDMCSFCQMNIVDARFGAEIVTGKGKVYKFDAVECMVNYIDRENAGTDDMAYILVNSYSDPGELYNAEEAIYLRTREIQSPMGMFISPFMSMDSAKYYAEKHGGKIYGWSQLIDEFQVLPNLSE